MSSFSTLIPGSWLRMRALQHRLQVSRCQESLTEPVSWDNSCRRDLQWWSDPSHLVVGMDLALPHPELLLFTDASNAGWGASLGSDHLSGLWSLDVSQYLINHRELLAVFLAIRGFLHLLRGRSVSLHRQYVLSFAPLQGRGHSSSTLNSVLRQFLPLRVLRCCSAPPVCPGSPQRLSRLSQPGWPDPRLRVNSPHGCVPGTFLPLASNSGFVRHLPQSLPPGVLFTHGRSSSGGGRCLDTTLGSSSGLCLPSVRPYPEGPF